MLVLCRKENERIVIGRDIVITVCEATGGRVRLGFDAPRGTPIYREEVLKRVSRDDQEAPRQGSREKPRPLAKCS
jgi:carbon storage regulator